jgi:hypothetical protein
MKRELQMRLAVAGFMQETLTEMASKKKKAGYVVNFFYFELLFSYCCHLRHAIRFIDLFSMRLILYCAKFSLA